MTKPGMETKRCIACGALFERPVGDIYVPPHMQRNYPALPCAGVYTEPVR